jgi:spore coat polysaccharide biosynthesis protein SpsF (cytidylyltransferase family)
MRKNPDIFKMGNYTSPTDYSDFRLTVDEPADYEVVKLVAENCDVADNYLTYVKFLQDNPSIRLKNTSIERNEGLAKSLAKEVSEEKINKTNL